MAGLEGIGLSASGFSIDTDNSSNSENVRVWYTVKIDVPQLGILTLTLKYQMICVCFVSYGHVGCQMVLVH